MRYLVLLFFALSLSSCYKNRCYTCTVKKLSADKSINTTTVYPEQYCGKKPKEISKIEKDGTLTTSLPNPHTGAPTDVAVTTTCRETGK